MPGKTLYCLGEAWLELNSTAPLASAETFSPRHGRKRRLAGTGLCRTGRQSLSLTQLGEDASDTASQTLIYCRCGHQPGLLHLPRPTPLLFDGGGEQLGCRTRSSELLYAPEQLGADWAADAEMLAFSSACLVDSPCRYTHLAALDTARTPVCRYALFPLSARLSGPAKRPAGHGDAVSPLRRHPRPHRRRDGASAGHPGIPGRTCSPCCGGIPSWWCLRQKKASTPLPGRRTHSGPGFPPRPKSWPHGCCIKSLSRN